MKKLLPILLIIALTLTACTKDVKENVTSVTDNDFVNTDILLPSYDNDLKLYGYVDIEGEWVIKPQYPGIACPPTESLENVDFNLLPAYDGEKWGYISSLNQWVIPPQYTYAKYFINGIAQVNQDEYIDMSGKTTKPKEIVIKQETLTAIEQNKKWGYVNQNNEIVITPKYDDCRPYSEGLAAVLYQGLWGFIDEEGEWVIMPKFDSVDTGRYGWDENLLIFQDGLALSRNNENEPVIGKGGNELVRIGFIDKQGEWAIAPQFGITSSGFSRGLACVTDVPSFEEWYYMDGYINKDGEVIAKWISYTDGTRELVYGECLNPYV